MYNSSKYKEPYKPGIRLMNVHLYGGKGKRKSKNTNNSNFKYIHCVFLKNLKIVLDRVLNVFREFDRKLESGELKENSIEELKLAIKEIAALIHKLGKLDKKNKIVIDYFFADLLKLRSFGKLGFDAESNLQDKNLIEIFSIYDSKYDSETKLNLYLLKQPNKAYTNPFKSFKVRIECNEIINELINNKIISNRLDTKSTNTCEDLAKLEIINKKLIDVFKEGISIYDSLEIKIKIQFINSLFYKLT